ncbi:MAG: nucleoside diphosphate kinase regulator [Sphingobium sp.]|jgi:regulator of nucleoside diphosphate kinase|uniref:nucleoside diphosphate kinase regulator n=1 Tax=Sphingomonadales TaxID=204457 RepID=UPI000824E23F|nr:MULTISPECIES: nucleoside diphosphate kinase regulator [Sphingomonadaceae]MBX9662552.1 nucleoside diphosphate kinase regulator [Novosphingobium sp.]MCI1756921.1 nucleoside diphosphate kinase regulator [Sphingobium sp.]OYX22020.1 MAG: transcription elongation factor GreAB [Rhodobacterales bacterium 32-66-9]HOB14874.1 nucleoside diphosphate kinase regulator [Novosphingobium sp.]
MTTHRKAQARPAIQIRETDAERISNLAIEAEDRLPQVAELLLAEINRATIVEDSRLPQNVVALQSTVKFLDEASGIERTLQLVYPQHADIAAGRISILSLVGAGLLGLKPGQSISWPDRAGKQRALRIMEVNQR